jgi:alkylation response protein AidB-like acyl-CoA dehydrogenase
MAAEPQDVAAEAGRIADQILFPSALTTDAADLVPLSNLDALADAGLYGLAGPREAGGVDADFAATCQVIEILAGACLSTAFVWVQHHGAVRAVRFSDTPGLADEWLEPLCRGERRAGLALAGLLPGPPQLRATRAADGWRFTGTSPWVTGWGRIDVVHAAARDQDDTVVWALIDARATDTFHVEPPLDLVAIRSTATVRAHFDDHVVPAERVTGTLPLAEARQGEPAVLRVHAALALGVAGRCCALIGPSPLDDELTSRRDTLDGATAETMAGARAAASELAVRAAAGLMVTVGSGSLLPDQHAQRLAREALFLLVFGSRPAVRAALLDALRASDPNA